MLASQGHSLDTTTRLPGFYSEAGEITLLGGIAVWVFVLIAALPASLRLAARLRRRGGTERCASGLVWLAILWPAALVMAPMAAPLVALRCIGWLVSLTEPIWLPMLEAISAGCVACRARRERRLRTHAPGYLCPTRRWDAGMPWNDLDDPRRRSDWRR